MTPPDPIVQFLSGRGVEYIHAPQVLLPDGITSATLSLTDGRISGISPLEPEQREGYRVDPALLLIPGLVDTHVHLNEPGRTDWEGFAAGTRAAAAGGVTTIVDMPLNSVPVTTTAEALEIKKDATTNKLTVDTGFWGGAVPENLGRLHELHRAGVFGFKCFTSDSGIPEFDRLDWSQVEQAMMEVAALDSLLLVHAEDPELLAPFGALGRVYQPFVASRPDAAETSAVAKVIRLARQTGARTHILHVSSAQSLPLLRAAKREGVRITAETCPHYLGLSAESIPDGATSHKCCPPIRDRQTQDRLWEAVLDGTLDCVVTDHSPATADLKYAHNGDWGLAWGGISSLQLGFSVLYTEATKRGIPVERVVAMMSSQPASLVGLGDRGAIGEGMRADFAVVDLSAEFPVDPTQLYSKNPVTPYAGHTLRASVVTTIRAGRVIYDAHSGWFAEPSGEIVAAR